MIGGRPRGNGQSRRPAIGESLPLRPPLQEPPHRRQGAAGRRVRFESSLQAMQVFGMVNVADGLKDRAGESAFEHAAKRVAKGERRAPAHTAQKARHDAAQTEEIVSAVGRGTEHGVTGPQLAQRLDKRAERHCGRISSNDNCQWISPQQAPEGACHTLPQPAALLGGEGEVCERLHAGKKPTGKEKVQGGALFQLADFAEGVCGERGLEFRRATRPEQRYEAPLAPPRHRSARENGDRREHLPPQGTISLRLLGGQRSNQRKAVGGE